MFYQIPNGTVLVISGQRPINIIGKGIKIGDSVYKIKGISIEDSQSILIERAVDVEQGQKIIFLNT